MADRFWVGGTANWDGTAGTKWATTSGGAGGETVPTSSDDVYFDANSGAVTVTVSAAVNCRSVDCSGFTGTLTGTSQINTFGSVLLVSGMTLGSGLNWSFRAASGSWTLTSAGKTMGSVTFGGVSSTGTWSLLDALTSASTLTVTYGTFTTNNYNVTATSLSSSNSNTRTINLGSSTVTLSLSGTALTFATSTNLTFNAGTSSIIFSGTNAALNGGAGVTFYNVSFTSTALVTPAINGSNTFNNLSVAGRASAGVSSVVFNADQTINGTLTLSAGTNATMRTFVRSDTIGTTRTLTCAAVASLTDIDFRDITIAGAAAPVSGTRLGDCKGNSGITFDAAKTVYWRGGTGTFGAANWSNTSGGSTNTIYFPLAQDTAVFNNANVTTGATATVNAAYNLGTIDMSGMTSNTMTLACSQSPSIYGNWINGTGTTLSGAGAFTFAGRGSQTITSAGKTFTQSLYVDTPGGSVTLQDALTCNRSAINALQLESGTLDANDYNITLSGAASGFNSDTSNARTLALGSGTLTIAGAGNIFDAEPSTNLTVTGTGTISLTSASAKSFIGGSIQTYPTINQGGVGTLTIGGSNKFVNITNTAIGRVQFTGGTTNEFTAFNLNGVSGNLLQLGSTNTTQVTLKAPSWNVGANSTDAGNNTGLTFSAGTVDYLSISYINGELTAAPTILAYIIESSTASSNESPIGTYNPSVSETTNAADTATAGLIYIGTLNESVTAADVAEAVKAYLAAVSEATTATDLMAASLTLAAAIAELTTATDSAAVTSRVTSPTIAEAAQMADALSGGLLFLSNISEATTASEIAESVLIFNSAVAEATTASEVLAAVAVFQAAVPEQVVGADVANALLTVGSAINEALTVLDSAVGPKTTRPNIAESASGSDSTTNIYTANPVIAETAIPLDAAQVAASTFSAAAAETAVPLDTPQGANTGSSSLSESAAISDAAATAFVPSTAISESSTAQESASSLAVFRGPIVEAAALADTTSVAPSDFNVTALAAAQATESFNPAGSVYNSAVPIEGAGITDSLIGAYLWNDIDDTQVPNWQNVNNTQSVTWTTAPNTQTPGWNSIPTSPD